MPPPGIDVALPTRLEPTQQAVGHVRVYAPTPSGSRPAWCVVATYATAEFRADHHLREQRFETYLPLRTIRRTHRFVHGKQSLVRVPLFPGYLFLRHEPHRPWRPITNTPGVFKLLTDADGYPSTCSDTVVQAVRSALDGLEASAASSPRWNPGTPCSLLLGPLAGMPAVVTAVHNDRASVAVMMLGCLREVAVSLDALTVRDD